VSLPPRARLQDDEIEEHTPHSGQADGKPSATPNARVALLGPVLGARAKSSFVHVPVQEGRAPW
jgi:hypothetical protein